VSLRTRIAAAAGLAVAVTVIAAALAVYLAVRSDLRGEVDRALRDRAAPFAIDAAGGRGAPDGPGTGAGFPRRDRPIDEFGPGGRPGRRGPPPGAEPFGGAQGYLQLVHPDGATALPPGQTRQLPVRDQAKEIARTGDGRAFSDERVDGTHLRVLTAGAGPRGAVQVARPLTEVDNVMERVLIALVLVGAIGTGLAVLLGTAVARTALGPIRHFTRRTEALAGRPGAISERIEVGGSDELARLARSFNTTLDALEAAVESQRQLVADASHELRTPIASLRANIQTLQDADRLPEDERAALRADIVGELDELTALVGDVVELARGTRPDDALDDVRLDELLHSLVERARRRGDAELHWDLEVEPTLIRGEPERIARAITNLLDNARKWSPPGGTVEVRLADGELSVRDHGPGFADEDLPRVFERFYRADHARGMPGSGLGLAIVRRTAEAHGGSAVAANAPGGGGLLRVSFGGAEAPETTLRHQS
jgi:two-component system sensor histidine kinase MprB